MTNPRPKLLPNGRYVIDLDGVEIDVEDVPDLVRRLVLAMREAIAGRPPADGGEVFTVEPMINLRWYRNTTSDYSAHAPGGVELRAYRNGDGEWRADLIKDGEARPIATAKKKREVQVLAEARLKVETAELHFTDAH